MTNNWIEFVKEYAVKNGLSYKEAMKEAKDHYQSGGSLKSNFIRNIIYKADRFNPSKLNEKSKYIQEGKYLDKHQELFYENENIMKVKKLRSDLITKKLLDDSKPKLPKEDKKPISEEEIIINNWNDPYIGVLIYKTKIGQNINNLISKKNAKDEFIIDTYLLSFTKPINDDIIKKYGVEKLFEGIDKIANYMDAEKYSKTFGVQSSLPISKYMNKTNVKLVASINNELLKKPTNKSISTSSKITFDEFLKLYNKLGRVINNLIKGHIDKSFNALLSHQQFNLSLNYANQLKRQYITTEEFKNGLTSKMGVKDIANIRENLSKYKDELISISKHKDITKNTVDEFKEILKNI